MPPSLDTGTQHLLRDLAPQVLGAVVRRFRDFAFSEDAVQEALIAAATQWPCHGVPENPRAWLIQVASRRIVDQVRAETARRHREATVVGLVPPEEQMALAAAAGLERLDALAENPRIEGHHRLDAVRAHLLERAGDREGAIVHYRRAAERTWSLSERNYLLMHAARLSERGEGT